MSLRGVDLAFAVLLGTSLTRSIWEIVSFSSTLVKFPDDSEIVMVWKQCSPETLFLDVHDLPLPPP